MRKQVTRGNLSDKVDRQLLHEYLWRKRDRMQRVTQTQTELAKNLGVTPWTMNIIYKEMLLTGRLRKVGADWVVVEPEIWAWNNPNPPPLGIREWQGSRGLGR